MLETCRSLENTLLDNSHLERFTFFETCKKFKIPFYGCLFVAKIKYICSTKIYICNKNICMLCNINIFVQQKLNKICNENIYIQQKYIHSKKIFLCYATKNFYM